MQKKSISQSGCIIASYKAPLWMEIFTQYSLLMKKQEYAYECNVDTV